MESGEAGSVPRRDDLGAEFDESPPAAVPLVAVVVCSAVVTLVATTVRHPVPVDELPDWQGDELIAEADCG